MKIFALLLFISFCFASPQYSKNEIGLNLGWGNPYGFGLQYYRNLTPNDAFTLGAGFSMAGLKYGVGYNRYFNTVGLFRPYFGAAFSGASGIDEITVTVNNDSALYKIKPGLAATPRAGIKMHFFNVNFYLNLGYGFLVSGGGSEFISGSNKSTVKDFADLASVGGLEISASMNLRF